jgi:phosphoribosylanthranilate isomerase
MKLKVCGMKYPDNISEAGVLHPDYMGFIFWQGSPRFFEAEIPPLPPGIKKTGIFVNETRENIDRKITEHQLSAIQLHGDETPGECEALARENVEIIKAFSIDENFDFGILDEFGSCDYFLFDAKGQHRGGNGETFNWEMLQKYNFRKPIFLSGGIGISELEKIKKLAFPIYAVDVNSKFETAAGLKNIMALQYFKNQLR